MFGVNSLQQVGLIAEGWAKDIVKAELELYEKRMAICRTCPLYTAKSAIGPRCDASKCWDTVNNKLVLYPGPGIICGCGCAMEKASRVKNKKCVLNKW